jgi:AAA domain-containing protein
MSRRFEDKAAVRSSVPLLVGLVGPSGSGKTMSALRLATGMQRVAGGDIGGIDTEASRMLHYADLFKFRHLDFGAPFSPLDYLEAVEHFARKGVRTIIIDSGSHMHEGPGGLLEAHDAETERLAKAWGISRDKAQMSGWQKPKSDLRRFLNSVLQLKVNTIWCFRAKEKVKLEGSGPPKALGFMPVIGDEVLYEMTLNCLLYPNSGGVPSWQPAEMGEKAVIKLPVQFKALFAQRKPLDEETGAALASWASGGAAPPEAGVQSALPARAAGTAAPPAPAADPAALEMLEAQLVANGIKEKAERWRWACAVVGRRIVPEAPMSEDEARLCLERAEREAAA